MLHDGQCATADLHNLNDDDWLARYYASSWFETCHTTLDMLGETLSLDDVVSKDETTQTGGSHVVGEDNPSTYRRRRHK